MFNWVVPPPVDSSKRFLDCYDVMTHFMSHIFMSKFRAELFMIEINLQSLS